MKYSTLILTVCGGGGGVQGETPNEKASKRLKSSLTAITRKNFFEY